MQSTSQPFVPKSKPQAAQAAQAATSTSMASQDKTGPNIIGNSEEQPSTYRPPINRQTAFDFRDSLQQVQKNIEENKRLERVSVQHFIRNVSTKQDLLFALRVKGKNDIDARITHLYCRLDISTRQALVQTRVSEAAARWIKEILHQL